VGDDGRGDAADLESLASADERSWRDERESVIIYR